MPLHVDGMILVSASFGVGTTALELLVRDRQCAVRKLWNNADLDTKHGGLIHADGRIYGNGCDRGGDAPWKCLDLKTGNTLYSSGILRSRMGSLTLADGMLYLFSEWGMVALAEPADDGLHLRGRFRVARVGRNDRRTWAHPVVCGGRLYIRYGDTLDVYDVRQ